MHPVAQNKNRYLLTLTCSAGTPILDSRNAMAMYKRAARTTNATALPIRLSPFLIAAGANILCNKRFFPLIPYLLNSGFLLSRTPDAGNPSLHLSKQVQLEMVLSYHKTQIHHLDLKHNIL